MSRLDELYSEAQLAKRFAVPASTIRRWLDEGKMPSRICHLVGAADRQPRVVAREDAVAWLRIYAPERDPDEVFRVREGAAPRKQERHLEVYGLSREQLDRLFQAQGGRCAMCSEPGELTPEGLKVLVIDHDHESGEVRGLLCARCNNVLGGYELARRLNAEAYLNEPPAWRAAVFAVHKDMRPGRARSVP